MTLDEKIARFEKVESMLRHIEREFILGGTNLRMGYQIINEAINRIGTTLDSLYAQRLKSSGDPATL